MSEYEERYRVYDRAFMAVNKVMDQKKAFERAKRNLRRSESEEEALRQRLETLAPETEAYALLRQDLEEAEETRRDAVKWEARFRMNYENALRIARFESEEDYLSALLPLGDEDPASWLEREQRALESMKQQAKTEEAASPEGE